MCNTEIVQGMRYNTFDLHFLSIERMGMPPCYPQLYRPAGGIGVTAQKRKDISWMANSTNIKEIVHIANGSKLIMGNIPIAHKRVEINNFYFNFQSKLYYEIELSKTNFLSKIRVDSPKKIHNNICPVLSGGDGCAISRKTAESLSVILGIIIAGFAAVLKWQHLESTTLRRQLSHFATCNSLECNSLGVDDIN